MISSGSNRSKNAVTTTPSWRAVYARKAPFMTRKRGDPARSFSSRSKAPDTLASGQKQTVAEPERVGPYRRKRQIGRRQITQERKVASLHSIHIPEDTP